MNERLSSTDVAFFRLEERSTPQHVGGLAVFEAPPGGFDYDRLLGLLEERISLVPRFRHKIRSVPFGIAHPVWTDDPAFDITYHVRRSALPPPGSEQALLEFCGRVQSRLLDRSRPLWEMYLVEGLAGGRVAIVTKTHHSMVDGAGAVDIGQVLLDATPQPRRTVATLWMPDPELTRAHLVGDALLGLARRPAALAEAVGRSLGDLGASVSRVTDAAGTVAGAVTGALHVTHPSPFSAGPGEHRRIAVARADLEDFRRVRNGLGGTVNDAILATVTGALRSWLLSRGEALRRPTVVRALVPVGVASDSRDGEVTGLLVDLAVGEPDPLTRLARVQDAMASQMPRRGSDRRPVGADVLASLSGFAPPTLHSLGARAAHGLTRRGYALAITNVPGPQYAMYAAGARLSEMFPFLPLSKGQALSVATTSYDGGVYFGITGDRDAMPDLAEIGAYLGSALAELVELGSADLAAAAFVGRSPSAHRRQESP